MVAELGAAYLCAEAGVSNSVIANQAAYVAGWLNKWRARHFFNNQQEDIM
jgi:antirestriction protein ArdC